MINCAENRIVFAGSVKTKVARIEFEKRNFFEGGGGKSTRWILSLLTAKVLQNQHVWQ